MRIALATCDFLADLYPGDRPLADGLVELGAEVVPWVWDQDRPGAVNAVVVRTAWDYWHKADQFRAWLGDVSRSAVLINPLSTLLWNLDKRYLLELAGHGVPMPATAFLNPGESLDATLQDLGGDRFVAKPAVSAGGDDTFIVDRRQARNWQAEVDPLLARGAVIIQEFAAEIEDGELSLLFFDGVYSHAVRKRAAEGEFRIHVEHGGTVEPASPGDEIIEAAARVLACLPGAPAYARVDGVVRGDELLLMELELIEPELFFDFHDGSARTFAEVIMARLADDGAQSGGQSRRQTST